MNEQEFDAMAESTMAGIESALEACAADLDFDRIAPGVLEIETGAGARIVLNRNGAAREIWMAAPAGGFHFRHDGTVWRDTRDGVELLEKLEYLLSAYCGTKVVLE